MGKSLFHKVWDAHTVRTLPDGRTQLFIGLHLIHEVTSPQAFGMMKDLELGVPFPERTYATVDHIIPTAKKQRLRPFRDDLAEQMTVHLTESCKKFGIRFFNEESGRQGIVHVVGPEQGLTQPGMTVVCGDSHTSTHGAFGALAMGIGTSEVEHVMATQTLSLKPFKTMAINVEGTLRPGVSAKDIILAVINRIGTGGGQGYVLEYRGSAIESLSMEG
ncbi:MAG TPA: aconitase family protein, partial [Polyangiales bacterium]|nr:aconitase family protein [Polyangiales bacterium]